MKKNAILSGLALIIILLAFLARAEGWHQSWVISLRYSGVNDVQINNLPLYMRDVPIHPAYTYADSANWAPIQETRYGTSGAFIIGVVKTYQNKKFRISLGLDWLYPIYSMAERNYTNHPGTDTRGYGAALTYVTPDERGVVPLSELYLLDIYDDLSPEISGDLKLSEKHQLYLCASVSYYHLQIDNGWDRYDQTQTNKTYSLGHYLPTSISLRWHFVSLGLLYPIEINRTSYAKDVGLSIHPSFTVKIEYGDLSEWFK